MFINISESFNSLNSKCLVSFIVSSLDEIKRANLEKLIKRLGRGGQKRIAEAVNTEPSYINNIRKGRKNLSDDMVERICFALNIKPYEFYIENDTPLPATDLEKKALYMAREAEQLHVEYIAEESLEYTLHRLDVVKKQAEKGIKHVKPSRSKTVNG